ncbi:hypothetical protein [Streptomyces nymphaeiformis]|uniref:Uncharacterized protein n=1 Tax=Streptomyces nymphaeiformis TaxID=2663842 RepID=A0A7W7TU68_9ACTN|nr:hypothetical protein [Streptomyces nymphaeiformis]
MGAEGDRDQAEAAGGRPNIASASTRPGDLVGHLAEGRALAAATGRFEDVGPAAFGENDTSCCYALQDEVWVTGPGKGPWEVYVGKAGAAPGAYRAPGRARHGGGLLPRLTSPWSARTERGPPPIPRAALGKARHTGQGLGFFDALLEFGDLVRDAVGVPGEQGGGAVAGPFGDPRGRGAVGETGRQAGVARSYTRLPVGELYSYSGSAASRAFPQAPGHQATVG